MFVLLMIPKHISNKSAHGWRVKYFFRNKFRSYIFRSDAGPSLSLYSCPHSSHCAHSLSVVDVLQSRGQLSQYTPEGNLVTTSVSENIQVRTHRLMVWYLALLSLGVSSALESTPYERPKLEGLEEVFPRKVF